jgi:hypothetical protein
MGGGLREDFVVQFFFPSPPFFFLGARFRQNEKKLKLEENVLS